MSADLFVFHGGGDGVERMKDGEKRKLTLLNPMRNVDSAVNIFFHTVSHPSEVVFSTSRSGSAQASLVEILHPRTQLNVWSVSILFFYVFMEEY